MAGPDPWKHRSVGMRCHSCMFWVEKVLTEEPKEIDGHQRVLGRCRRRAPTINGFPATFEDDWCGDHKLDEEKL